MWEYLPPSYMAVVAAGVLPWYVASYMDTGFSRALIVLLLHKNSSMSPNSNLWIIWASLLGTIERLGIGSKWEFTAVDLLLWSMPPFSNCTSASCEASLSSIFSVWLLLPSCHPTTSGLVGCSSCYPLCCKVDSTDLNFNYAGLL